MHRLLVDTVELGKERPELPPDAVRHLRVLRPKSGEKIELFDGHGSWRVYEVDGEDIHLPPAASHLSPPSFLPAPRPLTLFACVTKGSRWDWTIEKATELGVTRIVPVLSERTIVRIPSGEREAKRERWLRIVKDAARQSDAKWLPEVLSPVDFTAALPLVKETVCFIGALTNPPSPSFASALLDLPSSLSALSSPLAVFIGPEGDFAPEELAALMEIATPVSFGDSILRAETAAIFAVSVLKAAYSMRP